MGPRNGKCLKAVNSAPSSSEVIWEPYPTGLVPAVTWFWGDIWRTCLKSNVSPYGVCFGPLNWNDNLLYHLALRKRKKIGNFHHVRAEGSALARRGCLSAAGWGQNWAHKLGPELVPQLRLRQGHEANHCRSRGEVVRGEHSSPSSTRPCSAAWKGDKFRLHYSAVCWEANLAR